MMLTRLSAAWLLSLFALSASVSAAPTATDKQFHAEIQPLLAKYCFRCHGPKKPKGKIELASIKDPRTVLLDRAKWLKVLEKLTDEEMPPKDPLPSEAERKKLIAWFDDKLNNIDWSKVKKPGHVLFPRLNRTEYINTMRDLLGVEVLAAKTLSEDGAGLSGFNNDRAALFVPPKLMEKYFTIAGEAIDQVIAAERGRTIEPIKVHLEAEKMFMTERNTPAQPWGYVLNRGQMTLYDSVKFPADGMYEFRIRSWAQGGPTGARLRINSVPMGDIDVRSDYEEEKVYTITCYVRAGAKQVMLNIKKGKRKKPAEESAESATKPNRKKWGRLVNQRSVKSAPQLGPLPNESKEVKAARQRFSQASVSLQRPYEWLRLHGPDGDSEEILRFRGYIKERQVLFKKRKAEVAKAHGISLKKLEKIFAEQNVDALADQRKLLTTVVVKNAPKPTLKKKGKKKGQKKQQKKKKKPARGGGNGVAIDWIEIRGPIRREDSPPSKVFIAAPGKDGLDKQQAARQIIGHVMRRAYRRPVTDVEINQTMRLFQRADERGDDFYGSVKLALSGVLVSPNFLFRVEQSPAGKKKEFRINDYELASRLSYFLWLSMPDEKLFALAASGRLHEPKVLASQVERMLADERSAAFAEAFAGQWLGHGILGKTYHPDAKTFPAFNESLGRSMIAETNTFFTSLMRTNGSLLEMIDSRYAFLNEELAKHYGIKGVKGDELRRVALTDPNRGGVLGMGSVLTTTSIPARSSPVIRGKWVLETLLGEKQPEPPADVPPLPKTAGTKRSKLSFRDVFAEHRNNPRCASCHDRLDPIGFGLENFDGIGRWRVKRHNKPIDTSAKLPGGETFDSPAGLKQILLRRKADFSENITRRMLAFALGRQIRYYDKPAVDKITKRLAAGDYRAALLVQQIVQSYPFLYKTNVADLESQP
jgi:hypothetical protein